MSRDYSDVLGATDATGDLKRRSVYATGVMVGSQALLFLLRLGGTVVLARLLKPAEHGLVGMVTAIVALLGNFSEMGLSWATVQEKEIRQDQVTALFWINLVVGAGICLVVCAAAPVIAWFYKDSRLLAVALAQGTVFLISGSCIQHSAVLSRRMKFTAISVMRVLATASGLTVSIYAAVHGAGYWSLVLTQPVSVSVMTVGILCVSDWHPHGSWAGAKIRDMLKFGGHLTVFGVVHDIGRRLDNILIGKFCGAEQLGLYGKAYGLLMLPLTQLNTPAQAVAVPALSRLVDNPSRYRRYYTTASEVLGWITMPLVAWAMIESTDLFRFVLGPNWVPAAPIFAMLGFAALVEPVTGITGWLFTAEGRGRDFMHCGLVETILTVTAIVVGLHWGALGIAVAYSGMFVLVVSPFRIWFTGRKSPVSAGQIYGSIVAPLVGGGVSAGAVVAFRLFLRTRVPLLDLVCSLVCCAGVAALTAYAIPSSRRRLTDVVSVWRERKQTLGPAGDGGSTSGEAAA